MESTTENYPKKFNPMRFNISGHAHELTFSCFKQRKLLASNLARTCLADAINAASEKYEFEVWTWVFMPEHVHLLIYPTLESYSISDIIKSIKQAPARRIITHIKKKRPDLLPLLDTGLVKPKFRFWQDGGGYDRNYFNDRSIRNQIEYINRNPVRRGLVENPEDWKWSSAGYWLKGAESAVNMCIDYMALK